MGLLNLRLLSQSVEEKGFFPDLNVVAEKECNAELKKDKEISSHSKPFFPYSQTSDAEGGMAKNENIDEIFIHEETLVPFFELCFPYFPCHHTARSSAGRVSGRLPVKIE